MVKKFSLVMSSRILCAAVVLLVALMPSLTSAATILRAGETINVTNDQVVDGDFYASGGVISQSGVVNGDLYAVGGSFTNNGEIKADLTVVGGSVQIHSPVADDVRVAAGEVIIAGPVGGDVVVFGGLLKVLSTADIAGDILFFGGELQILGSVDGSVMGTAETVRIDAHVGGSTDVTTRSLSLGDRAEVLGDVRYVSEEEITRSQNAVIVGEVVRNTLPEPEPVSYEGVVVVFILVLFTALIIQLLFRSQLTRAMPVLMADLGMAGLIGIALSILVPVVSMVLLVSVLGSAIAMVLILLSALFLVLWLPLASIFIGVLIRKYMNQTTEPQVLYTVLGAVALFVLMLIPIVGPLVVFIAFFITAGAFARYTFLRIYRS